MKFKKGDRVIVSILHNMEVFEYHGIYKTDVSYFPPPLQLIHSVDYQIEILDVDNTLLCWDGIVDTDISEYLNGNKVYISNILSTDVRLDKQYYREQRLDKILTK